MDQAAVTSGCIANAHGPAQIAPSPGINRMYAGRNFAIQLEPAQTPGSAVRSPNGNESVLSM
jgi:hypothetical protein